MTRKTRVREHTRKKHTVKVRSHDRLLSDDPRDHLISKKNKVHVGLKAGLDASKWEPDTPTNAPGDYSYNDPENKPAKHVVDAGSDIVFMALDKGLVSDQSATIYGYRDGTYELNVNTFSDEGDILYAATYASPEQAARAYESGTWTRDADEVGWG
jgi:hypothetical protein